MKMLITKKGEKYLISQLDFNRVISPVSGSFLLFLGHENVFINQNSVDTVRPVSWESKGYSVFLHSPTGFWIVKKGNSNEMFFLTSHFVNDDYSFEGSEIERISCGTFEEMKESLIPADIYLNNRTVLMESVNKQEMKNAETDLKKIESGEFAHQLMMPKGMTLSEG